MNDLHHWRELDSEYAQEAQRYPKPIPSRMFIMQCLQEAQSQKRFLEALQLDDEETLALKQRIKAMINLGQLRVLSRGRLQAQVPILETGKVFLHPDGYGFFTPDGGGDDGFLPAHACHHLMHGDRVEALLRAETADGRKEYQVQRILERAYTQVAGVLIKDRGGFFVRSEHKRLPLFAVTAQQCQGLKIGSLVQGRIERYPSAHQPPTLSDVRHFADADESHLAQRLRLINQNLPHVFPAAALAEAEALPDHVLAAERVGRRDWRHLPFVTIDGADARDFDDAICVQKTARGWRLYVAIADVSHYVRPESALDAEALTRGTSVYFPDMVIPMLPEALSNELCSLNPHVDRLALVCTLSLDEAGHLLQSRFAKAVIHSQARLTYESAHAFLYEQQALDVTKKVKQALWAAKALFERLLQVRQERGALNFELPEAAFHYNAKGHIQAIKTAQRLPTHQLIEELMVLANIAAARFLQKHQLKALFRVHQEPKAEAQKTLNALAKSLKLKPAQDGILEPHTINAWLNAIKKMPHHFIYEYKILRMMSPACYLPQNLGHFGLALKDYCHFTSPIRRYPDLLVHRAISAFLNQETYEALHLDSVAQHCSECENRAEEASRDVMKHLKYQYLQKHRQHIFTATVSRIQGHGLWLHLDDYFLEGFLHISRLDGYFDFVPAKECLTNAKTKESYRLGQKLEVIIHQIDLERQTLDLALLPSAKSTGKNKKSKIKKQSQSHQASNQKSNKKSNKKSAKKGVKK